MRFAIWYHLYNLKNVKNTHALACNFTKINTPPWVFLTFFNYINGTKSRNAPHMRNIDFVNVISFFNFGHNSYKSHYFNLAFLF